jgi:prepilin-type N-terminal cleavage/methylation domain-containing protein
MKQSRISRRAADRRERRGERRGFTLVEVMIAIIVIAIGVMGLAGTASFVATQMGGGRAQTLAAGMATAVADSLSARRCSALVDGTQTRRGVTVSWRIADSSRTRWVSETVQYTPRRGPVKTANYTMVIQCPD